MSHDAWNTLRALIHPGARPEISLVVGAGMHMQWQATTDREKSRQKILASWPGLLRALSAARAPEQMRESLVWETLLLRQLPPKPLARTFGVSIHRWQRMSAAEREKQLQKCAATKLLDAEDAVAKSGFRGMESVRRVLNSTAVSDIISLNADLTIERLIGGSDRPLRRYPLNRRGLAHFRLIPRSDGSAVRVWHIHGDRVRSDSLRFGLRRWFLRSSAHDERLSLRSGVWVSVPCASVQRVARHRGSKLCSIAQLYFLAHRSANLSGTCGTR
jgi:hypothetical protein